MHETQMAKTVCELHPRGAAECYKTQLAALATHLLGTVRSPLLLQKISKRNALAVMAMIDDVTSPALINQ